MSDLVGEEWGSYRLTHLLGRGGFAEVYLGEHMRLRMLAAIKILHIHLSEEEAEAFLREAQTIADLLHPHIVRVLDFDVHDNRPFLVLDYAPNGSLRQRYPSGTRVPLPQVIDYVRQVADALQYAHENNLIHRDIKPANILLGRQQEVLLSDFGIVTIAHSTSSIHAEIPLGTLAYIAPEQIQGYPHRASDQYALAIVVYSWLCGELPFGGSSTEVIAKHLAVLPPSLREKVPAISPEVEQVVMQALAKDPKARFASVKDFANTLAQASERALRLNASSSPDSMKSVAYQAQSQLAQQSIMPTPVFSPEGQPLAHPALAQRMSRRTLLAAGAGLAVVGTAIGALLIPRGGPTGSSSQNSGPHLYPYTGHQHAPDTKGSTGRVDLIQWSPDNKRIVSMGSSKAGEDLTAHMWDALDGGHTTIYRFPRGVQRWDLLWTVDGPRVAWVTNGIQFIHVTDLISGQDILTYNGHVHATSSDDETVQQLAWSPDGIRIASAGYSISRGGVHVWDATNTRDIVFYRVKPQNEPGYTDAVGAMQADLVWSPDSKRIASWGYIDGIIHVWSAVDGSEIAHYQKHWEEHKNESQNGSVFISFVAWSPDGKHIASIGYGATRDNAVVHVWNPDTGRQICTHGVGYIRGQVWSPDSKMIASGVGAGTQIWNPVDGKTIITHNENSSPTAIAWSPDGKRVGSKGGYQASSGVSGPLIIWDATTGEHAFKYEDPGSDDLSLRWSSDGKLLAVTKFGGTIEIVRVEG
jgi:eukaryotic-like serine/threonine-protein kinase